MKNSKEKPVIQNQSPIVISSDESKTPTPRARAMPAAKVAEVEKMYVNFFLVFHLPHASAS